MGRFIKEQISSEGGQLANVAWVDYRECDYGNCSNPVFSRKKKGEGYCKYHQNLRTDSDYLRKQTALKGKQNSKPKSSFKKSFKVTGKAELFRKLIEEREHVSFLTGIYIQQIDHCNCAHVVPATVAEYKEFSQLDPENIIFLTHDYDSDEHTLYDAGTKEQRARYAMLCGEKGIVCRWDKINKLYDTLIEKYKLMKEQNL